ncbi:MAG: glucose/arabinose dehydrogenase [Myxococcota bacterium]|jgi:glucose/arabinose dehydrogenase
MSSLHAPTPVLLCAFVLCGCTLADQAATQILQTQPTSQLTPLFDAVDADKPRIDIALLPLVSGLGNLTDVQHVPGSATTFVALDKSGTANIFDSATGQRHAWFTMAVATQSEQGLLGVAFAPDYATSQRFFTYSSSPPDEPMGVHITRWQGTPDSPPERMDTVLSIGQPYRNHNGGQIAFGADGMLYAGIGDGGAANDPHGNGQNGATLLGSILRLDVSMSDGYAIPTDNPFVSDDAVANEIAIRGARNPWRFTPQPDGSLIVADVGQDLWEEVSIARPGDNLGWNTREADHCFPPGSTCDSAGLLDPVWVYDHDTGKSITGGVVVTGDRVAALTGKYLVGDFTTGRMWALDLSTSPAKPHALGHWDLLISTFAVDANGNGLVADYGSGTVFQLVPSQRPQPRPGL